MWRMVKPRDSQSSFPGYCNTSEASESSNQKDLTHKNHCNASRSLREYNVVTTYTSMKSPSNDGTPYHPSATSQHVPNTTPPWPCQYAAVDPMSVPHLSQYLQGCCVMQHLTGLEHHLPYAGIHHDKAQSEHTSPASVAIKKIKGPDNPTCQFLPISHQKEMKTEWERQERDMKW